MTTIACDGISMAADGREVMGTCLITDKCTKVKRIHGKLVGAAGASRDIERFFEWVEFGGGKPEKESEDSDSQFEGLILEAENRLWSFDIEYTRSLVQLPYATGSGGSFAMGAMYMGASPKRAVQIAMKRDIGTGGKITTLSIKTR